MYYNIFIDLFTLYTCVLISFYSDSIHAQNIPEIEDNVIHLPKCCPNGTMMYNQVQNCGEAEDFDYSHIEVYRNNETNYWEWPDVDIKFYHYDPCINSGRVRLEPEINMIDQWIILENGSVYLPNDDPKLNMINSTDYCIDHFQVDEKILNVSVFICIPTKMAEYNKKYVRGTLEFISAVCLFALAYYKKIEEIYNYESKKCLIMFCITTGITYSFMALKNFLIRTCLLQNGTVCYVLRGFQYYFTISYHLWILFFCIELFRNVSKNKEYVCGIPWTINFKTYIIITFSVPLFLSSIYYIVLIQFSSDQDNEVNKNFYLKIGFYYLPTGLFCILTLILGLYLYVVTFIGHKSNLYNQIKKLTRQDSRSLHGKEKNFYRSCCFLFTLMFLTWLVNLMLYLLSIFIEAEYVQLIFLDMLIDLLGVIVVLLYFKAEWLQCRMPKSDSTWNEENNLLNVTNHNDTRSERIVTFVNNREYSNN